MVEESYNKIRTWYDAYVSEFSSEDSEVETNINLIKKHTSNVIENAKELGTSINLDESNLLLLETAALLHDIGRFKQLIDNGTYADNDEVNHVHIGLNIIHEGAVLNVLSEYDKQLVIDCVRMHDISNLPKNIDDETRAIVELLRDADRIDVLRIVSDYYTHKKVHPNKFLDMEFKDMPAIAKKVSNSILDEKVANKDAVKTINDLKLSQMSWVFDFSQKKTFKMVSEKGYIKAIFETLPKTDLVIDMYRNMKIFMENQL